MRNTVLVFHALLFLTAIASTSAPAKDAVVDGGFETRFPIATQKFWDWDGEPYPGYFIKPYDVNGDGKKSYCFNFYPGTDKEGTLRQSIYLIGGRTYEFSADIAYYNC